MWALCTGHVEKNEDVQDAAIRELKEELGIDISIKELHSFANGKFDIINENGSTYFFYIKCNLKQEKFIIQKEELSQVKWFDIIDVISMIKNNDETIVYSKNRINLFEYLLES